MVISVLFVDDEASTLSALARFLRKDSYDLHFATGAAEALHTMAATPIHILVTDMQMPSMGGLSLLNIAKKKYPDTVRLALSAFTSPAQLLPCINSGKVFRYITKPVEPGELRRNLLDAGDYVMMRKNNRELVRELQEKNRMLGESVVRREETIEKLMAAEKRLKQLSGLLPICSACKKIREDNGSWSTIETYMHEHTEAEFSHSICPECAQKLYPDIMICDD